MTLEAVRHALGVPNAQESASWGDMAGSEMLQLATDRGLDTDLHEIHRTVIHHACLADLLVTTLRKPEDPPWQAPEVVQNWTSGCYVAPDGSHLRRVVLVSHWTSEREESERRSWFTLGEQAFYGLPMKIAVLIIGHQTNGKRHSPWTTGYLHPSGNKQLRFRRKVKVTTETFSASWIRILREDHDEISREKWLESMLKDDVMSEVAFSVEIPCPDTMTRFQIRNMAHRKMDRLANLKSIPDKNLSSCDWPVPCPFKRCCWSKKITEPSEKYGYLKISP